MIRQGEQLNSELSPREEGRSYMVALRICGFVENRSI